LILSTQSRAQVMCGGTVADLGSTVDCDHSVTSERGLLGLQNTKRVFGSIASVTGDLLPTDKYDEATNPVVDVNVAFVPLPSIGNFVWLDLDMDGLKDANEDGIASVQVILTPPSGIDAGNGPGIPVTKITGPNGGYLFADLPSFVSSDATQGYVVTVNPATLPAGVEQTFDEGIIPGSLGTLNNSSEPIQLDLGEEHLTADFGYAPTLGSIGNVIWIDANDNGVRDSGELGLSGVIVNLTDSSGAVEDPVNLDADFGYLPPEESNNSIGGTIWIDSNADGVYDPATEAPIAGVTMSLIDFAGNVDSTEITDANGKYLFIGVPDAEYTIEVTDQHNVLAGLDPTFDSDGLSTLNRSMIDLDSAGFDDIGVEMLDQDFGYTNPNITGDAGSIGNTIFFDADASGTPNSDEGIEGVVVELFDESGVLLASTTTNENGNYLFTGLAVNDAGIDYSVAVLASTLPNGDIRWNNVVDPDGSDDSQSVVTLTTAAPIDLDQDFGYLSDDDNTLSGTVFQDDNGDGEQNESDRIEGVTLQILDVNGNVVQSVVTDVNGNYEVTNLLDGVYRVVVTDDEKVLAPFEHTDSPNGLADTSDGTSKDDSGYLVDLDSARSIDQPVTDATSDFGYQPSVTNPISLGSFNATSAGKNTVFTWVTQTEVSNIGFQLYASIEGEWVTLNKSLILGQGDSVSLQTYSFTFATDATVFALADVDIEGKETLRGPFLLGESYGEVGERKSIDWSSELIERNAKETMRKAKRLEHELKRNLQRRLRNSAPTSSVDGMQLLNEELSMQDNQSGWVGRTAALLLGALIPSAHSATLAEEIVNLETTQVGIHSVSYTQLQSYGLEGVGVGEFALMNKGESVPVHVIGSTANPAVFGEGSSIRFIAEQVNTLYSGTNVYTLGLDAVNATAISVENTAMGRGSFAPSYLARATHAPQKNYSFLSPDAQDPWSASRLIGLPDKPASEIVTLTLDQYAAGGNTGSTNALLSVNLWGSSNLGVDDHHVQVSMNGKQVLSERFTGLSEQHFYATLDNILNGSNRVTVTLPGDTGYAFDVVAINQVEVRYPRSFVAIDGRLNFTSTFAKYHISGVPLSAEYVVMSDRDGVVSMETNILSGRCGSSCAISFAGHGGVAEYYVSTLESLYEPTLVALPLEQNITQGQAKYLVISHPDFIGVPSLTNYMSEITAEMGSAKLVDVEAVYAQFGDHLFDPAAIKDYIAYAAENLGAETVLLIGGDVYDYRQFEVENAMSFIPSIYASTGNNINFAPVDAKYVDLNDDNVPDLSIGRLAVRTEAQLNSLMSKRASYLARDYHGKALMVADEYDDVLYYDYARDANDIAKAYLNAFDVSTAYVDELGVRQAGETTTNKINEGQSLTAFFGHSSTNQWTFTGLFNSTDAANLSNIGKPTVVTQWGCWNAYYVSPSEDSMGHRFMMEGDQGAVAVMGATTLTDADHERALARLVFARLANGERLGDAVLKAKQEYALENPDDLDVLLGWTVLGMPELIIK